MLKAGALYYAVAVSLLIGLVSASLIMLAYQQRIQSGQLMVYDRLINNAHSGLQLMLVEPKGDENAPFKIDLFDDNDDSVAIWQMQWGVFLCHYAKAHSGRFQYTKVSITGGSSNSLASLYLADMGRPLSLCGKTVIRGNAMLPAAGVKRAYIEGKGFVGTRLVDGITGVSNKQLPELYGALQSVTGNLSKISFEHRQMNDGGVVKDSVFVSFNDQAGQIHFNGPLTISSSAWCKGKLLISSSVSITVSKGAMLEDVILKAPSIVFEKDFTGTVQAIATDSIVLESDVMLRCPSALVLEPEPSATTPAYIKVDKGSSVLGLVLVAKPSAKTTGASVYIAPTAVVEGMVYVDGKVSLEGSVEGSLYCREFYLRTSSSVYENYLLDGVIDKTALHPLWQQPVVLKDQSVEGYLKWLY